MQIKRTLTFIEEIAEEAGQCADPPLRKVAVAAIIDNPFAGRFERDLKLLTDASAEIGRTICMHAISVLAPHKAQSYGKAAIIGINGEQEHGVSMLTTVFGNVMREAAGGGKATWHGGGRHLGCNLTAEARVVRAMDLAHLSGSQGRDELRGTRAGGGRKEHPYDSTWRKRSPEPPRLAAVLEDIADALSTTDISRRTEVTTRPLHPIEHSTAEVLVRLQNECPWAGDRRTQDFTS